MTKKSVRKVKPVKAETWTMWALLWEGTPEEIFKVKRDATLWKNTVLREFTGPIRVTITPEEK